MKRIVNTVYYLVKKHWQKSIICMKWKWIHGYDSFFKGTVYITILKEWLTNWITDN